LQIENDRFFSRQVKLISGNTSCFLQGFYTTADSKSYKGFYTCDDAGTVQIFATETGVIAKPGIFIVCD
jgi:hypothetical protein